MDFLVFNSCQNCEAKLKGMFWFPYKNLFDFCSDAIVYDIEIKAISGADLIRFNYFLEKALCSLEQA